MVKRKIMVKDIASKQLNEFEKNVKKMKTIKEKYRGNFVAVLGEEVIGYDTEFKNLIENLSKNRNKKELYIEYIPKIDEVQ